MTNNTNQTHYSLDQRYRELIEQVSANTLRSYVDYVLWECSTEFMANHGLPTDADVNIWITWLQSRIDHEDPDVQHAIFSCREYTKG